MKRDLADRLPQNQATQGSSTTRPTAGDRPNPETDPRRPWDPPWYSRTAHRHLPDDLAVALRGARCARGWSLTTAAEVTGVSRQMLSHLEHGCRLPSVALAQDLIKTYGLDHRVASRLLEVARPEAGRSSPFRAY